MSRSFWTAARRASPKSVVISVIDPSRIFGNPDQAPRDGARAVSSYEVAGELGDPEALVRLGDLYRQGSIVPKDLRAALAFFRMARDRGYAGARWRLAEMMLRGEGLPVDRKEARAELEIAAAAGVSTAMLMLGDLAASGETGPIDAEAAVSRWQRAADAGEVRGLVRLASLYYDGLIVPRDPAKAYRFFEEAGAKGDSYAAVRTAQMLLAGDGVAADRAADWRDWKHWPPPPEPMARLPLPISIRPATRPVIASIPPVPIRSTSPQRKKVAVPPGCEWLSCRFSGKVQPPISMAGCQYFVEWRLMATALRPSRSASFSPAERLGSPIRWRRLLPMSRQTSWAICVRLRASVDIFASGNLVPREPGKALEYYRSAAERGDVLARLKADEFVVRGTGTPQEARTALTDIERLAATGLIDAIVLIGDLGRTGVAGLVPTDEKAALASYLLAADKGSRTAALRAGEILISGLPANLDPARGVSMMLSVAEAGDASAYLALGDALLKAGSGYSSGSISPVEAFEKAGAGGMSTAYLRLGDIYRDGVGVPVDGGKAAQYYMKAAGLDLPGDGNDGQ